jgi:hypothetical protein
MTPVAAEGAVDLAVVIAPAELGPGGKITVPGQLMGGSEVTINYDNPSRPNQSITIEIDSGMGDVQTVVIETDANGSGSAQWTVPSWDGAVFNGPEAGALSKSIQ